MHIHLGDYDDLTMFYDTEDETINAVGEFAMFVTKTGEGAFESLGDKSPALTEAFTRYNNVVAMLAAHDLSIKMIVSNLVRVHSEEEAEAVQVEVMNRMQAGDFVRLTDEAVILSTRFGYVLGMVATE